MPFEWAADLTPEAIAGDRMELMTSVSDLVVMKPLGESLAEGDDVADSEYLGAAIEATSKVALRVLVVVPLDAAVAPLLTLLVDAAMGVIIAPFATLALVCIIAILIALVKWCRDRCVDYRCRNKLCVSASLRSECAEAIQSRSLCGTPGG